MAKQKKVSPDQWDVADLNQRYGGSYRDFEGFTGRSAIEAACQYEGLPVWDLVAGEAVPELRLAVRDLTMNLVHEFLEASDVAPTPDEVYAICHTVFEMLTCRQWVRVDPA